MADGHNVAVTTEADKFRDAGRGNQGEPSFNATVWKHLLKCTGTSVVYAVLVFATAHTTLYFLWDLYDGSREAFPRFSLYGRTGLDIFTLLAGGLAARSYHPTWRWGLGGAILAAALFRITDLVLEMHGNPQWWHAYRDGMLKTTIDAIIFGLGGGVFTVRRQL